MRVLLGLFAIRLNRGPSLCVFDRPDQRHPSCKLPSGRAQRVLAAVFFRPPSRRPDRARSARAKKESYWLVVPRQMVSQIGKRLLRVVRLLFPVHAVPSMDDDALAETKRPADTAIVNIVLAVVMS